MKILMVSGGRDNCNSRTAFGLSNNNKLCMWRHNIPHTARCSPPPGHSLHALRLQRHEYSSLTGSGGMEGWVGFSATFQDHYYTVKDHTRFVFSALAA